MRKIFLLIATLLFSYEVKIVKVDGSRAKIDYYVKKGVSGYVICKYLGEDIICARAVAFGKEIKFYNFDNLKNPSFAVPQILPQKGDRVILAKNYNRILIIAPNQDDYLKIKELYKNASIISSDVLAASIEEFNEKSLKEFAKRYNIGRFIFGLDKLYEVDAFSFYVIKQKDIKFSSYKRAFFTYFKSFDLDPFRWRVENKKMIIKD